MVLIKIERGEKQSDGSYTYNVARMNGEGVWREIPSSRDRWDIEGVYHFIHDNGHAEDSAPIDFGEGVMHDFVVYADQVEISMKKFYEKTAREKGMIKRQTIPLEHLDELLAKE